MISTLLRSGGRDGARGWLLLLASLATGLGCHGSAPALPPKGEDTITLLDSASTRGEVTDQLGVVPRCLALVEGSEVCEWRLASGDAGYPPLARAMSTGDRIGVICELPTVRGSRKSGTCSFHQRRSNRSAFAGSPAQGRDPARIKRERERNERKRAQANTELDAATTALAMVRLLGELPERCDAVAASGRLCEWVLGNQSYGHGLVAASIDAALYRKVRVRCRFGSDGHRIEDCSAASL